MSTIPLQLVTGFLGSGKTTFLKNYLDKFSGSRRIGIIQNEFSELNVDAVELNQTNSAYEILEVNNGSVFCVCLLGSFVGSLAEFIDQAQPDELIMEASGMSDPLSIGQILQAPQLKQKVWLDQVWCLVDALNFMKMTAMQTRIIHQIRIADTIILNKTDLVEIKDDGLIQLIKNVTPFAKILPTSFARIEFEKVKPVMKFLPPEELQNSRPNLESQVVKSNRKISPQNLDEFIKIVSPGCIRAKGYINQDFNSKVFMQLSFDQITLQQVEFFASPTEFVVIGNFQEKTPFQKIFDSLCTK